MESEKEIWKSLDFLGLSKYKISTRGTLISIKKAVESLGIKIKYYSGIRSACKNGTKYRKKYWRYVSDEPDEIEGEIWKEAFYSETYIPDLLVSDKGRLKDTSNKGKSGQITRGTLNKKGYRIYSKRYYDEADLEDESVHEDEDEDDCNEKIREIVDRRVFQVHRIVASTFIPCEGMDILEVNHINFDTADNDLDNLEWMTHSENCMHTTLNKQDLPGVKPVIRYELEQTVVKEGTSLFVEQKLKECERYPSMQEASRRTGVSHIVIAAVCNGKRDKNI